MKKIVLLFVGTLKNVFYTLISDAEYAIDQKKNM